MILVGNACEGRGGFSLAACADDDHALRGKPVDVFGTDERTFRYVEIAKFDGHLDVVDHASSDQGHLALVANSSIDDLLHAREQRGKGSDENAPAGVGEDFVKRVVDDALRWCEAR